MAIKELRTEGEVKEVKEVLARARATYGNRNQIMVCIEELNELACVLAKYPRYDDEDKARKELHQRVLDEFADVTIILDHVQAILGLHDDEICDRIYVKAERVNRWLSKSTSMQETVSTRELRSLDTGIEKSCKKCYRYMPVTEAGHLECAACHKALAYDGNRAGFIPEESNPE